MFILGNDSRENAKRLIKALRAHAAQNEPPTNEPLYLVLNTKIHMVKHKDYTPRIIPITHKLAPVDGKAVLLITRDTSYRAHLTAAGSPTEDLFHDIIAFPKIKLIGHSQSALRRLYKENDLVVADARIHHRLPDILGLQFYGKNKKVPYKILMAKTVPGKKTHGKTDQLCEPAYVKAQLKAIVGNTSFIPPAGGTCVHIVVGYTNWKVSEVLANINDVVSYLVDEQYQPVGGLLRTVANFHSVLIKTSSSVALPVLEKKTEAEESELSDF